MTTHTSPDRGLPTPDSLVPSPQSLPPSSRDFEIHRLNQIEHLSTRQLAEKYKLSQTRIRQIVRRTSDWIAERLPAQTDLQLQQQERLTRALAADEYQYQLERMQTMWDATHEIKYHRQLIRVIAAKARLGTLPGAIDLLLPDEEDERMAGALQDAPTQTRSASEGNAASTKETRSVSEGNPVSATPQSAIPNPQSAIETPPQLRDCSPQTPASEFASAPHAQAVATTSEPLQASGNSFWDKPDFLLGLKRFESRLLTLIANTNPNNCERLQSLNESLADIRQEIAEVQPRLAQETAVASITLSPAHSPRTTLNFPPTTPDPNPAPNPAPAPADAPADAPAPAPDPFPVP